uniref:Protein aveugle n=1 Tax=Culex pipiens TaxID=7175 RepID=A0A8D8N259_CULPI
MGVYTNNSNNNAPPTCMAQAEAKKSPPAAEESVPVTKTKSKTARPKPVYLWTVADSQKWLRRHCSERCATYSDLFQKVGYSVSGMHCLFTKCRFLIFFLGVKPA